MDKGWVTVYVKEKAHVNDSQILSTVLSLIVVD